MRVGFGVVCLVAGFALSYLGWALIDPKVEWRR